MGTPSAPANVRYLRGGLQLSLWHILLQTGGKMLQLANVVGTPERSIIVETKVGARIANYQAPPPGTRERDAYTRLRGSHPFWRNRRPAYGLCNCYGLVWATRRTAIEDSQVPKILNDDGYRRLTQDETPMPGDVVEYVNDAIGRLHVGLVVDSGSDVNPPQPVILSKWSDYLGEDIHRVRDVHFGRGLDHEIHYWTDR